MVFVIICSVNRKQNNSTLSPRKRLLPHPGILNNCQFQTLTAPTNFHRNQFEPLHLYAAEQRNPAQVRLSLHRH